jgi:hypothetical protein
MNANGSSPNSREGVAASPLTPCARLFRPQMAWALSAQWRDYTPALKLVHIASNFPSTAMTALRRLEEMKILKEMTGRERNRRYIARAILKVVA